MNVLSTFDGISCLQLALLRAKIKVDKYFASEIDQYAIQVTQKNFPNTIQLGDVNSIDYDSLGSIDFLGGGSPCQDISSLNKKRMGLDGVKSSLFWNFVEAKERLNPKAWLLENVSGNETARITSILKTRPIKLNSNYVSPQNRKRLYWTNIPVNSLPQRKTITLQDILETNVNEKYYQNENWLTWWLANKDFQLSKKYSTLNAKRAACLTARMYTSWNGNFIQDDKGIRRLTTVECERLQTIPDGYTSCIPDNHAYKALGNCWTVDIITHILKHIPLLD